MLQIGSTAPEFSLPDKDGNLHSLKDYRGKRIALYFYPRDNTPGCTRQALAFRETYEQLKNKNLEIIGISKDSPVSHERFAEKYDLPFLLLSDQELTTIKDYGVWQEKKLYGKTSMGVVRTTFVIDENGILLKIFPKAKPDTNAAEILAFLDEK